MQKVRENKTLAVTPCITEILIPQTQNAPNRHPGLCRTKLDNISAGVKHATRNHFCHLDLSPCDVHKTKTSKRHMPTGPSCTGRGAIPCHLRSHCANGFGHGMVTAGKESGGYHIGLTWADIIWIFVWGQIFFAMSCKLEALSFLSHFAQIKKGSSTMADK